MNFNEEIAKELKELGAGGEIIDIKDEDKATPEDYIELERKLMESDDRITNMIRVSQRNAKMGLPCEKYQKLHDMCIKYPTIQLTADECYPIPFNNFELEKGPILVKKK